MADESKRKLAPMFLIKPGSMKPKDIKRAEKLCGIVIVECNDADAARAMEPPIDADLDVQAWAALTLVRRIVHGDASSSGMQNWSKATLVEWFVKLLMDGRPLRTVPQTKPVKK